MEHLPVWKLNSYQLQTGSDGESDRRTVVHGARPGFVVVCSHDCDIENIRERSGLAVAPVEVPTMNWPEHDPKWEMLAGSWQLTGNAFEFGHLFPLDWEDPPGLRVVNFSLLTTAGPGAKAKRVLLDRKVMEVTDEVRANLQLKLAAFFGRPAR